MPCEDGAMTEAAFERPRTLPTGRLLAIDEQGVGLRATWHLDRGFVNLSLWRHDRCVETFHLSIEDAGRLTGFLIDGFTEVTNAALGAVDEQPGSGSHRGPSRPDWRAHLSTAAQRIRTLLR
jgi:hypothetical protein